MELSPNLLTDIEFREQWRGYSPTEVDEFLERVAAGVGELQQRLAEALERASAAERKLLDRTDEDEIRRTLVLAQRTAVSVMEEARTDADRLVSEADAGCRQLLADARAEAARLDAEIDERRHAELAALAEQRAALEDDIARLEAYVDEQRTRVAATLRSQLEWLERDVVVEARPSVSTVDLEPEPAERTPEPEPELLPEPAAIAGAPVVVEDAAAPGLDTVDELRLAREELADALRRAGVHPLASTAGVQEPDPAGSPDLFDDEHDPEPTGVYDLDDDDAAAAEPVEPRWRESDDDDPFLAELRRAVGDTEPLGPRDHEAPASQGGGDDDGTDASGFFRRGRRRP